MDISKLMTILHDKHREYVTYALIDDRVVNYRKLGNVNYMDSFRLTKSILEKFTGSSLLPLESIDFNFHISLENKLKYRGVKPNSIGHTWSTLAQQFVSLDTISRALGHRLVSDITMIYVEEDQKSIDELNHKVIRHILRKPPSE